MSNISAYVILIIAVGLGTAATVSIMSTIGFDGWDYNLPNTNNWTVAPKLSKALEDLRRGRSEDPYGWNIPV